MARTSKPVTIGGKTFATTTEAVLHFRQILNKYMLDQPVEGPDHADLLELIKRHPCAAAKIGSGVAGFVVTNGGRFGHRTFVVIRTDGSRDTFCCTTPIRPSKDPQRDDALWAMRCEVAQQTRDFFDAALARSAVFCEITGERLTPKTAHVDHTRPLTFQRLARDFLATRNLTLADVATTRDGPHKPPAYSMADRELAEAWAEYHRTHAKLRIASKRANLKERKAAVDFRPTPTLF